MSNIREIVMLFVACAVVASCGEGLVDSSNREFVGSYTQLSSDDVDAPSDGQSVDLNGSSDGDDVGSGTIGVGGPCILDSECLAGLSCFRTPGTAGMCSRVCDLAADDCPGSSSCVSNPDAGRPIPLCFQPCQETCLYGDRLASCVSHANFVDSICLPLSCSGAADCPPGSHCVLVGNYCQTD